MRDDITIKSYKMEAREKFKVIYSDEAADFIVNLPRKARDKVSYKIEKSAKYVDHEIFKKLTGTNIWEFRTIYNGICYRLFAFWDTEGETLVIATHGIIKKTQEIPSKEIAKAEAIRKEWFDNKRH